jgi:hypothetical protein
MTSSARAAVLGWIAGAAAAVSIVCGGLGYRHYLALEFNELGRHFDEQAQVVITDSAFAWFVPTGGFALLAVLSWRLRSRTLHGRGPSSPPAKTP